MSAANLLPMELCLFGGFRLLRAGVPVVGRTIGKAEALLAFLALGTRRGVPRETLMSQLWPDSETTLARQSLNSLIYNVRRLLSGAMSGREPVVTDGPTYRLNLEAGITVDVIRFEELAEAGDRHVRAGQRQAAVDAYSVAIGLYRGDLYAADTPAVAMERERLRATYLMLLARLADIHLETGDLLACLKAAHELLVGDPCREDALRLVMRSYVRLGERAQALRQFRLTETFLRNEFDAAPEPATLELWDEVRLHPERV
jgi:DNA-binding SARP family transcriptional activator